MAFSTRPEQCLVWRYSIPSKGRSGTWSGGFKTSRTDAKLNLAKQAGVAFDDVEVVAKTKVTRSAISRLPQE